MIVTNAVDLGQLVRHRRRQRRMSQSQLCEEAAVSRRWLSDFESGKPTAEIGLVLRVIQALGLALDVSEAPTPEFDLDEVLRAYNAGRGRRHG